jgi:hypothetical protein
VDRPPPDFSPVELTRDEVEAAGRYAWCASEEGVFPRHAYDGINFWTLVALEHRRQAATAQVPWEGWRHKDGCRCEFCGEERGEGEEAG